MGWIKNIFCSHDYEHFFLTKDAKMCDKVVVKNGFHIGSRWRCKKCGRVKHYH